MSRILEGKYYVESWQIVLLLLLILVVSTAWEVANKFVDRFLRRHGQGGLEKAWGQLKLEVLTLGIISLVLVVFEARVWLRAG